MNLSKSMGWMSQRHESPMSTTIKLNLDKNGKMVNDTLYLAIISSLLYLAFSWPNIVFSVGLCSQF